ncbi:MAG: crossover junction endodeoxyribonuclease RuvC [Candidatus Pacebacteria bacterium]|nr:crossover junction endodeoxyribonuclease RuvC [Candidatus Paceibacterota bacterium]MBP9866698.1 crossover junction endodeoxyribonuclease RuvC [Candidatus Paceibacterota bacterium]
MNNTPIRILGIDPGFDRLGICILDKEGNKEVLIHSQCITTSKKESFEVRLAEIGEELTKILKKYKPHELAIETLFFTTNQKTIITVAEVRGICIYLSHIHDVKIHEYSPPQIKLAVTGYGKATKDDIALMVPKILGKPLKIGILDDEIDAIAIALTHSAHRKSNSWNTTL